MSQSSHSDRTIKGVNWNLLRVIVQTVISLGVMVYVTRLLPADDFGLLALAMVFIGFGEIISSMGMGSAIVQRSVADDQSIRIANTLAVCVGGCLVVFMVALATPVSWFFDYPEVGSLLQVLSIGIFAAAVSTVSRGLLMRRLDFRRLFFIDSIAHVIGYAGGVVLFLELGYGIWAVVYGTLLANVFSALLSFVYEPFKMSFRPDVKVLKELLSFGGTISISNIIGYFARNLDVFTIGKLLDAAALGYYNRAYHLVNLPLVKIAATLTTVMFSSYSEVKDDQVRVREVYTRVLGLTVLGTFPLFVGMLIAAPYLIVGLYGERWEPAVLSFQVLCLMGLIRLVMVITGPIVQAVGLVKQEMWLQVGFFVMLAISCIYASQFGIAGVASAVVVSTLALYFGIARLALHATGLSWRQFFAAQVPGYSLGVVVALCDTAGYYVLETYTQLPALAGLVIMVMISGVSAVLGFLLLPNVLIGSVRQWVIGKLSGKLPARFRAPLVGRYL
ncbi:MAG: lipopolysaccharide biosynthesis protein [Pontibacterium sp.]